MSTRLAARSACMTALALAVGCVNVEGTLAPPAAPVSHSATSPWRVGAASIDITPPVGYGMAGHAIEARSSAGVWTRLRAHAIAIEDRDGVPIALVAADLWAIPAGLADRTTEILHDRHELHALGRAQLVLAATHTHHGPGHFSTAPGYADHAGAQPGFDPVLFEWLAERLAYTVADAFKKQRAATLDLHVVAVPAVARNRSLAPFVANPEARALLDANVVLPGCERSANTAIADDPIDIDPCHAVDPTLHTLVARDAQSKDVIAIAAVFGVHATAMPNRTPLYHADMFGIATQRARQHLAAAGHEQAVVALFNGPEGDVSPNWDRQGRTATRSLGGTLAEAIVAAPLSNGAIEGTRLAGTAGFGLLRTPLSSVEVEAAHDVEAGRTGRRAIPGAGQFGGAEDGRTRLERGRWIEGTVARRERRRGHGSKRPALPPALIALLHPKDHFPSVVPVGLVQLGALSFVTLPGEFTTVLGQRIEHDVREALGHGGPTIAIGLSGEYLSYFTTPQEYDLQHYEGASVMYGRLSGHAVAQAARDLASNRRDESNGPYRYRGRGKTSARDVLRGLRRELSSTPKRANETLEVTTAVRVSFDDLVPHWPTTLEQWTTPRVRTEVRTSEGWQPLPRASDEGDGFALWVTDIRGETLSWEATWLTPHTPLKFAGLPLRIYIQRISGPSLCTPAFETNAVAPRTTPLVLDAIACSQ